MNKQKFNSVVVEPDSVTLSDAKDLSSLAKTYPYSQIIHSLVAKGYSGKNEQHYKKAVATAAMYTTDRQVLKELVMPKQQAAPVKRKEAPQEDRPKEVPEQVQQKEAPKENTGKRKVDIDVSSFNTDSEILRKSLWTDLEQLKASKASYLEAFDHLDDKKTTSKAKKTVVSDSKKTTSKTSTAKNIKAESKTKPTVSTKASTKKQKTTSKKATTTAKPKATVSKIKETSKEPVKKTAKAKSSSNTTKAKASKPKAAAKKDSTSVKKKAENPSVSKASIKEQIKIIDSFIDREPSISSKPVKTVSGDQKDLSEKSTSFGDDLLSENLAQILVEQGKTQKAIDMYKKLIWKFPQKKTYFAARIEELTK
ncbi:tetratricopeptide repeat protein [Fulvivirga lutea]|uniref:Tetratricopeptide repeat protein n=1 Tax=Fulvivirga lutea TaxID=2810512 RepID=A0A974WGM4_9BACT|nr:tetratricopeptide repeat protein [Fulvivirga lutea]QSE96737.1 hypothetical protein JR347_14200 [Fulvivirga lutea]